MEGRMGGERKGGREGRKVGAFDKLTTEWISSLIDCLVICFHDSSSLTCCLNERHEGSHWNNRVRELPEKQLQTACHDIDVGPLGVIEVDGLVWGGMRDKCTHEKVMSYSHV